MVLRLVPGRPPPRCPAPTGPPTLGGRTLPPGWQTGVRLRRLSGTDLAGPPSPPRPGRPHLVLRPPPRRRSVSDRLSPPRATSPPRVVNCSPLWSSPSPARTATLTSTCPLAQQHGSTASPSRPLLLTRRQSSGSRVATTERRRGFQPNAVLNKMKRRDARLRRWAWLTKRWSRQG